MEQLPAIITKARARLLVRAPFIGSIALGLAWVNAPDIGTMATDGRSVWFNPDWCERHGVEKTMGVIAHEVLHVVNRHHLRRGERDAELWNVAADLLINRLLEDDKYVVVLPKTTGKVLVDEVAAIYCRNFRAPDSGYCGNIRNHGTWDLAVGRHRRTPRPRDNFAYLPGAAAQRC